MFPFGLVHIFQHHITIFGIIKETDIVGIADVVQHIVDEVICFREITGIAVGSNLPPIGFLRHKPIIVGVESGVVSHIDDFKRSMLFEHIVKHSHRPHDAVCVAVLLAVFVPIADILNLAEFVKLLFYPISFIHSSVFLYAKIRKKFGLSKFIFHSEKKSDPRLDHR